MCVSVLNGALGLQSTGGVVSLQSGNNVVSVNGGTGLTLLSGIYGVIRCNPNTRQIPKETTCKRAVVTYLSLRGSRLREGLYPAAVRNEYPVLAVNTETNRII